MTPVRRDLPTGTVTFLFTDVEGSTKLLRGGQALVSETTQRLISDTTAPRDLAPERLKGLSPPQRLRNAGGSRL